MKPIITCDIFDILYFVKSYRNIPDIIHYFSCKLKL